MTTGDDDCDFVRFPGMTKGNRKGWSARPLQGLAGELLQPTTATAHDMETVCPDHWFKVVGQIKPGVWDCLGLSWDCQSMSIESMCYGLKKHLMNIETSI